jgi:hypothetical protein
MGEPFDSPEVIQVKTYITISRTIAASPVETITTITLRL